MKIHLLWATIRPQTFIHTYSIWKEKVSDFSNVKTYVAVNSKEDAEIIKTSLNENDKVIIINSNKRGVCYPSYVLSKDLEGEKDDIVVFASDDFTPCEKWDLYLKEKLKNKEGLLMIRDGYQLPDSSNMLVPVITIPILTFGCLEKLNKVLYHPAYNHMHSDGELYMNVKELGLLIDDRLSDTTTFTHHHWAAGLRQPDQNDVSYNNKWKEDEETWNKRKNLPLSERLKVKL